MKQTVSTREQHLIFPKRAEPDIGRIRNRTCNYENDRYKEKRKFSLGCPWSGFSWVYGVEVRDDLGGVSEFRSENPRGFF